MTEPLLPAPPAPAPLRRDASVLAIVPHFACEEWLATCLTSLLEQTRPLDGIVVVDDASSAPPVDIVAAFPDVTLVTAARNVGPYRLVQQVIDSTRYDAYLFQDADDWSDAHRLEQLLAVAEREGAELVGSDYVMIECDRPGATVRGFPADVNAALAASPTAHALQHPTSLVARSLVERVGGFASGMRFSGDAEFLRRAAHTARVVNTTRPLYYRRNRADSLTTSASTGHGSAARKAVLDALAERAWANVEAVARGDRPLLEPFSRSGPVELTHVCGPILGQQRARGLTATAPVADVPVPTTNGRAAADGDAGPAGHGGAPVFVTSAIGSLAGAVVWSLAQHPDVTPLGDTGWMTPLAQAVDDAHSRTGAAVAMPRTGRTMGALDGIGVGRTGLLDAVAATIGGLVSPTGGRWVAALPADPADVAAAVALFPGSKLIHVVWDVDAAGVDADDWLTGVDACLEAETAFGADRVQRVRFEDLLDHPEPVVRACLSFVGAAYDERATWPIRSFRPAPPSSTDEHATPTRRQAELLSIALCGPRPGPSRGAAERRTRTTEPAAGVAAPIEAAQSRPPAPGTSPVALLRAAVPAGATVAIVSKGDDRLVDLDHATGWHFPRLDDGTWAGFHPATSDDAIAHLADLRRLGARYLFLPAWALWWLDHYEGFRSHLEQIGHIVASAPDSGLLLHLDDDGRGHDLLDLAPFVPDEQRARETPGDASPAPGRLGQFRPRATAELVPGRVPRRRPDRPKVAVISWSVSHNPLGRAHLLADVLVRSYDVELIGARFDEFGDGIWPPLRDSNVPVRSFEGAAFPDHYRRMEAIARDIDADALVVCKPRLPSLDLGILAKALHNRPLILDVDDRELTFVGADDGVSLDHVVAHTAGGINPAVLNPFGRLWTRYCETLVAHADDVIVSNPSLQRLYGGTVVPHARDETRFDPARHDRARARAEMGIEAHERVVLFAGTPRRHKGIGQIVEALEQIGDPRNRLCVIGTAEYDELRDDLAGFERWIKVVPYQRFDDLPRLLAASDAVCVLQDPDEAVSQFQIPAKVTDALAMGVPCIVTAVDPLAEVIAAGGVRVLDGPLSDVLASTLDDPDSAARVAARGREFFLDHLSYRAVLPSLTRVIEAQLERPAPMPAEFERLLDFQRRVFADAPEPTPATPPMSEARPDRAAAPALVRRDDAMYDVVMFWKQNDTGIYGRRHDMFLRELAASPRIGSIVQFDAPVNLDATVGRPHRDGPTHDDLVHARLLTRLRGHEVGPDLSMHTFGWTTADEATWRERYADHVRATVAQRCSPGRRLVFWAYPKNFELPLLVDAVEPDLLLTDLVDDHRTWAKPDTDRWHSIDRHYADVIAMSDVLMANCRSMADAMSEHGRPIHVVPNGCEFPIDVPEVSTPPELADLPRPVVGYLGNLSSRLDIALLERLASDMPAASLVLVGSAHAGSDALTLDRHPNVHLVGPRPYDEAKRFAAEFDVGIIPHVDNEMTRAMNPLKAFVYAALGLPIVATPVANLAEMGELITVAHDHVSFVEAVRRAATAPRPPLTPSRQRVLEANSWTRRLDAALELLDAAGREAGARWRTASTPFAGAGRR